MFDVDEDKDEQFKLVVRLQPEELEQVTRWLQEHDPDATIVKVEGDRDGIRSEA